MTAPVSACRAYGMSLAILLTVIAGCSSTGPEADMASENRATEAPESESILSATTLPEGVIPYPSVIRDGVPEPAFTEADLELWAKLNFTTVVVLSAQGKLPIKYPDTGACESFSAHIESLFGNGLGYLSNPADNNFWSDIWHVMQRDAISQLLLEIAVLCPARYPGLITALSQPVRYQLSAPDDRPKCIDVPYALECRFETMLDFVRGYLSENAPFFESRTGSKALLGVELPPPWTSATGVFFIELLWNSCQLREQIGLPPTSDDIKKLREVAKALRNAYDKTGDDYFLIQSSFPLAIVEYYLKNPDDQYSPSSFETWTSRCTEESLEWWFANFGLK